MITKISKKNPKIIIALDYSNKKKAMKLINNIDPNVYALKIGIIMFYEFGKIFIKKLQKLGFNIFLDLKFHDIPNTVFKAIQSISELNVWMISVHICGGLEMLKSAKLALNYHSCNNKTLLMGVTTLTSLDISDTADIGINMSISNYILKLSKLAQTCSLDGIICPGKFVLKIKKHLGKNLKILTPGIRLESKLNDDQKNIITPNLAKEYKINYIVIGRAITSLKSPIKELEKIQRELNSF
ncbi:orotidine 5'-phosphate decarboxylase [Buchnera aphidicola (Schlechtendalia chinensis)]|uniref:Orotidine 5'-phosphate decarboxylase n=1 Tax=Buchnera aphidicola subsp. Schlechtendalia chinensis TaxID=118110 RepID=A0A172WDI1_BUCSC|nr:orotidine-5'-phosphate decarboxylase [Buchnera aphidicola]ANF17036.1 orotidine 5'-phosphate decarboxylase [Buchnera aphidicola (Schlechtendalia chinensis)]